MPKKDEVKLGKQGVGLTLKVLAAIDKEVSNLFESLVKSFVGPIPSLKNKKNILFTPGRLNFGNLFVTALGGITPNQHEREQFKMMLISLHEYIQALKSRTKARVVSDLNAYLKEDRDQDDIKEMLKENFDRAKNELNVIVNAGSNEIRNRGTALKILRVAKTVQDEDPTVYFSVIVDERNDPETYRLHLLPDRKTPRTYKLSEIENTYHKKGDKWPKIHGTNPNCRCTLQYLPPGYGFNKNGHLQYKSKDWNELKHQRDTYGLPQ